MPNKVLPLQLTLIRLLDLTQTEQLSKQLLVSQIPIHQIHEEIKATIAKTILLINQIHDLRQPDTLFFVVLQNHLNFDSLLDSLLPPHSSPTLKQYLINRNSELRDLTSFHKYFFDILQKFLVKKSHSKHLTGSLFHLFHRHVHNKVRMMTFPETLNLHTNFLQFINDDVNFYELTNFLPPFFLHNIIEFFKNDLVHKKIDFEIFRKIQELAISSRVKIGLFHLILHPDNVFLDAMFESDAYFRSAKKTIECVVSILKSTHENQLTSKILVSKIRKQLSENPFDLLGPSEEHCSNNSEEVCLTEIVQELIEQSSLSNQASTDSLVHKYVDTNSKVFEFSSGKSNENATKIQKGFFLKSWLKLLHGVDNEATFLFSDAIRVGQVSQDDHTVDSALLFLSTLNNLNNNFLKQADIFHSFFSSEFHEKDSAQQFFFCISNESFNRNGILINNSKPTDSKLESLNFFAVINNILKRITLENEERFFLRNTKNDVLKNNFCFFLALKNNCTIEFSGQFFNNYKPKLQAVFNLKSSPRLNYDYYLFYKTLSLFCRQEFSQALFFIRQLDPNFSKCCSVRNASEIAPDILVSTTLSILTKLENSDFHLFAHFFTYSSMCELFIKMEDFTLADIYFSKLNSLPIKNVKLHHRSLQIQRFILKTRLFLKNRSSERLIQAIEKKVSKMQFQSYLQVEFFDLMILKVKHLIQEESFNLAHIEIIQHTNHLVVLDLPQYYLIFRVLEIEVLVKMFKFTSALFIANEINFMISRSDSQTKADFNFNVALLYFLRFTEIGDQMDLINCYLHFKIVTFESIKILNLELIKKCSFFFAWIAKIKSLDWQVQNYQWSVNKVFEFLKSQQTQILGNQNCVRILLELTCKCVFILKNLAEEQFKKMSKLELTI